MIFLIIGVGQVTMADIASLYICWSGYYRTGWDEITWVEADEQHGSVVFPVTGSILPLQFLLGGQVQRKKQYESLKQPDRERGIPMKWTRRAGYYCY